MHLVEVRVGVQDLTPHQLVLADGVLGAVCESAQPLLAVAQGALDLAPVQGAVEELGDQAQQR